MKFPTVIKHNKIFSITAIGVVAAILAAATEALYTPLIKLTTTDTGFMMSVAFIFFGAGVGMLIVLLFGRKSKSLFDPERHLQKKDTGKVIAIILFALLSISLVLIGIQQESAASASILQNFSTVSTVLFAALILREKSPNALE